MSRGRYTCAGDPAPLESDSWTRSCAPIWTTCAPNCAPTSSARPLKSGSSSARRSSAPPPQLRTELREEIQRSAAQLRTELREEIQRSAAELRAELLAKIEDSADTLRRHFGVLEESLRSEFRAVAEGTLGNTAAINRLEAEMNRRFIGAEAVQRAAFVDFREQLGEARRDLAELRAGR